MKVLVTASDQRFGKAWWLSILPEVSLQYEPGRMTLTLGWILWYVEIEARWDR